MKKFITLLIIFLTSCSSVKQDTFVNPIFYGTMVGVGKYYDTVKITPTTLYVKNYWGYYATAKCKMLENTLKKVTLKCLHLPHNENNKNELIYVDQNDTPQYVYYEYIINDEEHQISPRGKYLIEYSYTEEDKKYTDYSERQGFFINTQTKD